MSGVLTREEYDLIKPMIRGSYPCWYLLELPNGQWGALWWAGLAIENASNILSDNFSGLACVGSQDEVQAYIHDDLTGPNSMYPAEVRSLKQMFRNVKPGRKARAPRWEDI